MFGDENSRNSDYGEAESKSEASTSRYCFAVVGLRRPGNGFLVADAAGQSSEGRASLQHWFCRQADSLDFAFGVNCAGRCRCFCVFGRRVCKMAEISLPDQTRVISMMFLGEWIRVDIFER
jgi:hypothetical protein